MLNTAATSPRGAIDRWDSVDFAKRRRSQRERQIAVGGCVKVEYAGPIATSPAPFHSRREGRRRIAVHGKRMRVHPQRHRRVGVTQALGHDVNRHTRAPTTPWRGGVADRADAIGGNPRAPTTLAITCGTCDRINDLSGRLGFVAAF